MKTTVLVSRSRGSYTTRRIVFASIFSPFLSFFVFCLVSRALRLSHGPSRLTLIFCLNNFTSFRVSYLRVLAVGYGRRLVFIYIFV